MNVASHNNSEAEPSAAVGDVQGASIRFACVDDAPALLAIYAPFIDTPVTFEEEVPALDEFATRIADFGSFFPYLVIEESGVPVGYAYAHHQAIRAAYAWNAELSVYLSPQAQGRGWGSILYRTLIGLVRLQGIKSVYGLVTSPNKASDRLHEALGFSRTGVQPHAGFTCGAWHDVTWYCKAIADFDEQPQPPLPVSCLDQCSVRRVIDQANESLARK